MDNKRHAVLIIMAICMLGAHFLPLFPQDPPDSESETWNRVSGALEKFSIDPAKNFQLIEEIDQLSYWTMICDEIKHTRYLQRLFSEHFPVEDINEAQLDILFFMLKAYTSPTLYEAPKPVIARLVETAKSRPAWFAQKLLLREDWRTMTRLMIEADIESISGERQGLREILTGLKDQDAENKLLGFFRGLDSDKKNELAKFEEFLKDPAGKLADLSNVYDLWSLFGRYNELRIDETGILQEKDDSISILKEWIKKDIDIRKIKVLFYLITHFDGGYPGLVMEDVAEDVFLEHCPLFIAALDKEPNWRYIIFSLSYGLQTAPPLGNTDMEMKIRAQLEFLKKHIFTDARIAPATTVRRASSLLEKGRFERCAQVSVTGNRTLAVRQKISLPKKPLRVFVNPNHEWLTR